MNRRVIVSLIGVFLVGALIGALVALTLDGAGDSTAGEPAPPTEEECAEAQAVIDTANDNIGAITEADADQDASFYAAILTEQRTITYVLDELPGCFPLAQRAGSEGFLDGIRALAAAVQSGDGASPVTPVEPTENAPAPAPDSGEPPASDDGE